MTDFTAYLRLGVDSRDAVTAQKDLDRMAAAGDKSDKSFKQLSGTSKLLGASLGGIGLSAATAQVINYADAWTNVSNVLMGVTDSSAAFASTQAKVLALSKDTFSSLEGTAGLYSEITRSVSELGINQERVLGVTRTINNLFLAGGKAASETAGAIRQLNQGLASGALRGDEFNSVAEGAPRILDALSQKLNITKGELRDFAAEGSITAEILIGALESYSDEAQKAVDTTTRTFSQSAELARTFAIEFVGASDGIKEFSATAGSALVTVAQNLDLVSDAVIVLSVAYGARLAGSLATATAAKVASIASARALAIAENDAAVGIARRATVEAAAAKVALDKARADNAAAIATLNNVRANGLATQSVGPLVSALNAQAITQQRLTAAISETAVATATANAANAKVATTGAAVAGTTALATATKGLGAAMALLGGPVGVAILAGGALYYLATSATDAEETLDKLRDAAKGASTGLSDMAASAKAVANLDLTSNLEGLVSLRDELQQSIGENSFFSEEYLIRTTEDIRLLNDEIVKTQKAIGELNAASTNSAVNFSSYVVDLDSLTDILGDSLKSNLDDYDSTASKIKELNDAEKSRAESVASSISELEKQNALFENQSKYAEILYDINAGLLKVTEAEKARYLAAAQANDQLVANKNLADSIESFAKQSEEDKKELDSLIESVDEFGGAWSRTGSIVADSLGTIGDALNDYSSRMASIAVEESKLAKARTKFMGDPKELDKISKAEKKLATERTKANLSSFATIAGAASEMFDEQSKARKALHGIEVAFSAIEMALTIQRSILSAKEAVLTQGKGDPYTAFARMAAMAAVVGAIGYSVGGVGGGSGGGQSAADIQAAQGTGSVLGSADKSESIVNALESYSEIGLEQLGELRGIRDALTGLNSGIALLARDFVSGQRFTEAGISGLGETQNTGGGLLGLMNGSQATSITKSINKAIFGSTKKSLKDTGLKFEDQELGDILAGNFEASFYNTIETTKKKLFGLSKKTSTKDQLTGLDAGFESQIEGIFGYIGSVVGQSVDSLGIESANALENFKVSIGKVSFKDLSGEEIQSELEAIFSQQADLLAEFVVPAVKDFQQIGEGLFETLTRISKEMATFNYYTETLGLKFNATGISAIEAQQAISELSGGMDKLTENLQSYYQEFFTEEERSANQMKLLSAEMKNLGYDTVPTSREAFRALIEGIDLTTEAGQKQFAGLIALNEVFAELVPATEEAADAVETVVDTVKLLKDAAQASFDALTKSVSAERSRIQGIVTNASAAKTALEKAVAAEKGTITEAYNARLELLKSQADAEREANRAIGQARIAALNEEASAVRDRIGGLQSLFDELSGAAADMALGGSIVAHRRAAEFEIDTALRNAQAGRGLPTDGRLSDALTTLRDNPSSLYANAQEMAYANAVTQNKITELAGFAGQQLSTEEKTLASLEAQIASAESLLDVTTTSFDKLIEQATAQYEQDIAAQDAILASAQAQFDKLTGIDTGTLSVESALTKFNESLLAADFEDAQQQYARLDGILEQGKLQLDTLLDIDSGVLSLRDAIDRFAEAVNSADQKKVNEQMIAEMKRTADEIAVLREDQRKYTFLQVKELQDINLYTRETAINSEPVA